MLAIHMVSMQEACLLAVRQQAAAVNLAQAGGCNGLRRNDIQHLVDGSTPSCAAVAKQVMYLQ